MHVCAKKKAYIPTKHTGIEIFFTKTRPAVLGTANNGNDSSGVSVTFPEMVIR